MRLQVLCEHDNAFRVAVLPKSLFGANATWSGTKRHLTDRYEDQAAPDRLAWQSDQQKRYSRNLRGSRDLQGSLGRLAAQSGQADRLAGQSRTDFPDRLAGHLQVDQVTAAKTIPARIPQGVMGRELSRTNGATRADRPGCYGYQTGDGNKQILDIVKHHVEKQSPLCALRTQRPGRSRS